MEGRRKKSVKGGSSGVGRGGLKNIFTPILHSSFKQITIMNVKELLSVYCRLIDHYDVASYDYKLVMVKEQKKHTIKYYTIGKGGGVAAGP